jgi:enamine deaminase RidA (YjgF/YER057c/UK114 family)
MTFNAGRYQAMSEWFGEDLAHLAPAATGVGHAGADLEIHALFAEQPGTAIENPQQVPAYRYSDRYGRLPPCFARATRVGDRLMISGTAAVVGEDSRHANQFDQQLDLAAAHLLTVARQGLGPRPRFEHVRAYLPQSTAGVPRPAIARRLCAALTGETDRVNDRPNDVTPALAVEFVVADLCRKDLLVEVEAVARAEDTAL